MKKFIPSIIAFIFICFNLFAQKDDIGSGRAIRFDGVDDYIDLRNIYDDVTLPITISAWIYVEPELNIITLPIFDSQDNSPLYNGFTMTSSTLPHIGFTYGDGQGGNNPVYRRARAGYFETMGRWIYITASARSALDMDIYMNGFNVSGDYQGSSNLPMNSDSPTEVAKIGYLFSNGNVFLFKGIMDELRIWDRSLSEQEIRETMCRKLKGDELGLIGYWTFDETSGDVLKDLSSKGYHGTLKGNPTRVFSGAPVGDESVFFYTNDWSGKSLVKDDLSVVNISGNPYGVHIYKVNAVPSQTGGLNLATIQPPYYGIFLASDDTNNFFDLSFTADKVCQSFQRSDNSKSSWVESEMLSGFPERLEIIPSFEEVDLEVNLGPDIILCNEPSFLLKAQENNADKTFQWSTGQTSSSITVTSSGAFWVTVKQSCKIDSDTIQVSFLQTPPAFSLGENEISCRFEPRTLNTDLGNGNFDFTWQDGSKEKTFQVVDYGVYWLKVENACGSAIDSVWFSRLELNDAFFPNFISPNNSDEDNQFFVLDSVLIGSEFSVYNRWGKMVYQSLQYQNNWDGEGLPSGTYFYTIRGTCLGTQKKGTVTIMR